jgi:hypothetical protein
MKRLTIRFFLAFALSARFEQKATDHTRCLFLDRLHGALFSSDPLVKDFML